MVWMAGISAHFTHDSGQFHGVWAVDGTDLPGAPMVDGPAPAIPSR